MIESLSSRVGNLVFKQYEVKTVVYKWLEPDPKRAPTPRYACQRGRIKDAAVMTKSVLAIEAGQAYNRQHGNAWESTALITPQFMTILKRRKS